MKDFTPELVEMDLATLRVLLVLVSAAVAVRAALGDAVSVDLVDDGEAFSLIIVVPEVFA